MKLVHIHTESMILTYKTKYLLHFQLRFRQTGKQRTNPLRYRIICRLLMDTDVGTEYINKCTLVHFIGLLRAHC